MRLLVFGAGDEAQTRNFQEVSDGDLGLQFPEPVVFQLHGFISLVDWLGDLHRLPAARWLAES
jgi:hypothetical protein